MPHYKTGALVHARKRKWIVQPSPDEDLLLLKPLGGTEEEITGIYLPLKAAEDELTTTEFPAPVPEDLGAFPTAKILLNAARLSFRSGAGPFRSLGKLSFRPRSYQIVPLIMALRQEVVRLLIADDVGIGKTPESLLIVKELLERRDIERFAVICPPHLCDQWQRELKEKFDLDAVIIRSSTQARLDRDIQGDASVYAWYPFQIISIDYIKNDPRCAVFVNECPELVIVDEAHTCAKPAGADKNAQLRHSLLNQISSKPSQHLILLTATPHSGKPEEFSSLLGLLRPEFAAWDIATAERKDREALARHFIQRKRGDVTQWMDETTPFPKRDAGEIAYTLSPKYRAFWIEMLRFAEGLLQAAEGNARKGRMRYWAALALLRGVMSSPATGVEMLNRRLQKSGLDEDVVDALIDGDNPVLFPDFLSESDTAPTQVVEHTDWTRSEASALKALAAGMEALQGVEEDAKLRSAKNIVTGWISEGYQPVIFCRYISTAKYVGSQLAPVLRQHFRDLDVQVITSEDPDEIRKERIDGMRGDGKKRLLIATDCLSEGINLQESFNAVLHYDLPWNPNRLEQREGRVDRFGQPRDTVKAYLLYGKDNPIDGVILRVIIEKVKAIRKDIGTSIPFPEDSQSVMDAVLAGLMDSLKRLKTPEAVQASLFDEPELREKELKVEHAIRDAAEREKKSRQIFAQHAIKAGEIEADLKETDEALGNPQIVESFVRAACEHLGIQLDALGKGYLLHINEKVSEVLKQSLPPVKTLKVTFYSPVSEGYFYLGRNGAFVEALCSMMLASALQREGQQRIARASVIRTNAVATKTTLMLFRVRNVIGERDGKTELVAEEMLLWGYRGSLEDEDFIGGEEALQFLESAKPVAEISNEQRAAMLNYELEMQPRLQPQFQTLARNRAQILVEGHERFRKALGGARYRVVEPVLPIDVMGVYVLLPQLQRV